MGEEIVSYFGKLATTTQKKIFQKICFNELNSIMYLYIGKMMKVNVEWENMSLISKIVKKLGCECEMKCEESTFSIPNVKKEIQFIPTFLR